MSDGASGSRLRQSLIVETTRGTTPASPAYKVVPILPNSFLQANQTFERSGLVRADRQGGNQIGGTRNAGGTLRTPVLLEDAFDLLLRSALSSNFASISGITITGTFAATGKTFTRAAGSFITDALFNRIRVGDRVTISGTASNNGVKTVASVTATVLTFVETITNESSISTTFAPNRTRMLAGTSRVFFSCEEAYTDLSLYKQFKGMEVNTWDCRLPTTGAAECDFNMLGTAFTTGQAAGATYTALAGRTPCASSVDGTQLLINGTVPDACVQSASFQANNNRSIKNQVGSRDACAVEEGDFDVTVNLGIYIVSLTNQTNYQNGTRFSLEIQTKDQQDGHRYIFVFPRLVFTAAPVGLDGNTLVENFTAFAEFDPTTACKMYIERSEYA